MTPTSIPSAGPHGARNGGGVSSKGPAVNKFGNSAGSSSLSADVYPETANGLALVYPRTPGAAGATGQDAGGIQ